MKKLFTLVFVLSFVVTPVVSHAGLFDFLRSNQGAQIRTTATTNTTASTTTTYRRGDRAAAVLEAQQALSAAGLYAGDLSGLIGPRTEAAIKAWQTNNRLPATGILDAVTLRSIIGRGADNERGGGENRDGEFNGNFATTPPSLDYLQARCNANEPAFVRVLSPWEGDQYVYEEDGAQLQIFVCDATGTGNTHLIDGLVSQQIDIQNWSAIGPVEIVVTLDDTDMVAYGPNTWLATQTLDEEEFEVGHHSLWISDEGGYKINNVPQYGTNVYAGWTRPFEVVNQLGGGSSPLEFTLLETNDEAAAYTDAQDNSAAVLHLIFKIKNTSDDIVYMEKSCGSDQGGVSTELINEQNQETNPTGSMCLLSWTGTITVSNKLIINPGEEAIASVVFVGEPTITPANYKAVIDTVNYQTPLISSPTVQADIIPAMMTNYRTIVD